jgi:hypothetical protein
MAMDNYVSGEAEKEMARNLRKMMFYCIREVEKLHLCGIIVMGHL